MFECDQYELLDFGRGRKLERFGQFVLDRPSPPAEKASPADPDRWHEATATFRRSADSKDQGRWDPGSALPKTWQIRHRETIFELKPTEFGHLGVFVEQAANWDWIAGRVRKAGRPIDVLNLFAYTGGSTLAAAAAGARVTHVDAAGNVVDWARRNAVHSGLADAPIRWIADDARRFVARELRRGRLYDAVILDPPSYGHGPSGNTWKLQRHLMPLLRDCAKLTAECRAFILLTAHSRGVGPAELSAYLADGIFGHCQTEPTARNLTTKAADGRRLNSGVVARWP